MNDHLLQVRYMILCGESPDLSRVLKQENVEADTSSLTWNVELLG